MSVDAEKARRVFLDALAIESLTERSAHLDDACAGDAPLRREVEDLLAHHAGLGPFLAEGADKASERPAEASGTTIGDYELGEEIGAGGFGVVHLARQLRPVRRDVALKILKPGMGTREVVARFEAERQALALMEHPNIAKVHAGGTTSDGRPYFVMELVRGKPIDEYCDASDLTLEDRLGLFTTVCRAVQHAHQRGVIHRDLKPSNVLVAMQDGRAAPKVIDFGVAKALGPSLTEETFHTRFAQLIGTPAYMSPEQAELSGLDIDTRCDVYALGVLLYELLTGSTPLTRERVRQATFDELRHMIRAEVPPTPSARLTSPNGRGADVASRRRTDLPRLIRRIRGDLDWIVMKAIEKDRARRYESASALAADVERYLSDQPVAARPPSTAYRVLKFVRRHRAGVAIAAAVLVGLAAGGAAIGWAARDRAARRTQIERSVTGALAEVQSWYDADRLPEALGALQRAEGLLAGGEAGETLVEEVRRWRRDLEMLERLDRARQGRTAVKNEEFDREGGVAAYEEAFRDYGLDVEAVGLDEAARRVARSRIRDHLVAALQDWIDAGQGAPGLSAARTPEGRLPSPELGPYADLEDAWALLDRVDDDPWRGRMREAARAGDRAALLRLAAEPQAAAQHADTVRFLAHALIRLDEVETAVDLLRRGQWLHPDDFWVNTDLGILVNFLHPPRPAEAAQFFRAAIARRPDSPAAWVNLGLALHDLGDDEGAVEACRRALELKEDFTRASCNLATDLKHLGRLEEAEATILRAIRLDPDSALAHVKLAMVLCARRRYAEAVAAAQEAIRLDPRDASIHLGLGDMYTLLDWEQARKAYSAALEIDPANAAALAGLGAALRELGQPEQALPLLRRAAVLQPDLADAQARLGEALIQTDPAEAERRLRRAVQLDPRLAPAWNSLGVILLNRGAFEDALEHFQRAIALVPTVGRYLTNAGSALAMLGRLPEAVEQYQRALSAPHLDRRAGVLVNLGMVLIQQERVGEALEALEQALALRPDDAELHNTVAWTLSAGPVAAEIAGKAVRIAQRAVELAPKESTIRNTLGLARYRAGEYAQAIEALQKAIELNDGEETVYDALILAMAHWHLGKKDEARAWLEKAASRASDDVPGEPVLTALRSEAAALIASGK